MKSKPGFLPMRPPQPSDAPTALDTRLELATRDKPRWAGRSQGSFREDPRGGQGFLVPNPQGPSWVGRTAIVQGLWCEKS